MFVESNLEDNLLSLLKMQRGCKDMDERCGVNLKGAGREPWSDRGELPLGKSGESILNIIEIGESKGGGKEIEKGFSGFHGIEKRKPHRFGLGLLPRPSSSCHLRYPFLVTPLSAILSSCCVCLFSASISGKWGFRFCSDPLSFFLSKTLPLEDQHRHFTCRRRHSDRVESMTTWEAGDGGGGDFFTLDIPNISEFLPFYRNLEVNIEALEID
ncbi:hypothetical protein L2E82_16307 [Cichorium intybus]|uniref:Uncharacterized protein n=1 Tax=Cichorium intybus TaxID=13427 RepID=A0ACB9F4P8_CICIN|nr:hypothetical protein L2E82_16307 [Cichorium intybus]